MGATLAIWSGFVSGCFLALFLASHALPLAAHDAQPRFTADGWANLEQRK